VVATMQKKKKILYGWWLGVAFSLSFCFSFHKRENYISYALHTEKNRESATERKKKVLPSLVVFGFFCLLGGRRNINTGENTTQKRMMQINACCHHSPKVNSEHLTNV
jgi:hypothetical protein